MYLFTSVHYGGVDIMLLLFTVYCFEDGDCEGTSTEKDDGRDCCDSLGRSFRVPGGLCVNWYVF